MLPSSRPLRDDEILPVRTHHVVLDSGITEDMNEDADAGDSKGKDTKKKSKKDKHKKEKVLKVP